MGKKTPIRAIAEAIVEQQDTDMTVDEISDCISNLLNHLHDRALNSLQLKSEDCLEFSRQYEVAARVLSFFGSNILNEDISNGNAN